MLYHKKGRPPQHTGAVSNPHSRTEPGNRWGNKTPSPRTTKLQQQRFTLNIQPASTNACIEDSLQILHTYCSTVLTSRPEGADPPPVDPRQQAPRPAPALQKAPGVGAQIPLGFPPHGSTPSRPSGLAKHPPQPLPPPRRRRRCWEHAGCKRAELASSLADSLRTGRGHSQRGRGWMGKAQ